MPGNPWTAPSVASSSPFKGVIRCMQLYIYWEVLRCCAQLGEWGFVSPFSASLLFPFNGENSLLFAMISLGCITFFRHKLVCVLVLTGSSHRQRGESLCNSYASFASVSTCKLTAWLWGENFCMIAIFSR